ncbi:proline-rich protein 20A-like [Neophocaena asiaeorientalis asiaeorientalis]|uniref:Proline-rich protein 20A-like n=1 Tax=Neophocaena asiaeorientalis asiaeorientalis TaxID=1706337 RepID=A0A341CWP7_NEOAA|nr:proline-rich protein 20A-like [Neophocaena asiaeorientalis asiaeorientalis]
MQEQRPSKRFRSTAPDQGVHPQETGCPGAEGGDPGGAAGPPQPGQPSRPFAYVNPMRREAPAFVDSARLAQRGRGHRRGDSQGAERGRGRDPRLQEGPGRLLGPDLHLELDSGEVPQQPAEPGARETPFTRAAMAAAAHGHVLRNPGPGSDTLRMRPRGPPNAYGFWGLREVQPSACSYVGFIPSGFALIVMQTPSGTYLYSVAAPYAHHSQPLSL